jgi:hypothetical protein
MKYTIDDYLIVEAKCCRKWPVAFGAPMGRCGICNTKPIITNPLVIIREPKNWDANLKDTDKIEYD